jgi:hypothetical protein
MVAQRIGIEALDVSSIVKNMPFPVTKFNFFGRSLQAREILHSKLPGICS